MKRQSLQAQVREVSGRKVRALRADGMIPATVYGRNVQSMCVSVLAKEFERVYKAAGETGLIDLTVGSEGKPVLVHHVQKDPVRGTILHVEFHQVDLREKVKATVPLVVVGESPAVAQKVGALLTLLSDVEVEALPANLPDRIDVDVSSLTDIGQELKVADLRVPSGVTMLSDATVSVVKIGSLVSKEAEEQAAAEASAQAAAAPAEAESAPDQATTPAEASEPAGK